MHLLAAETRCSSSEVAAMIEGVGVAETQEKSTRLRAPCNAPPPR
jgi:hypothetical protein